MERRQWADLTAWLMLLMGLENELGIRGTRIRLRQGFGATRWVRLAIFYFFYPDLAGFGRI